ncbi:MAG: terpene cyclase/mutase family protein [Planctomycetes bacterium]|nr:terpene cyclase/mutase family protein [Planctomycetota bacterium]
MRTIRSLLPRLALPAAPAAAALAQVHHAAPGRGDDAKKEEGDPRAESKIDFKEIDARTEAAIQKGLQWLASQQNQDGSFGREREHKLAITSLAGLAFLANGSSPDRGPFCKAVQAAQEYVLSKQTVQGLITDDRMYTHGFATLFLTQLYGMNPTPRDQDRLRLAITLAVRLIERIQLDSGGWYYEPNRASDNSDISVTICEVSALRAARNAGIQVNLEVVRKARDCVLKAFYKDNGGFAYRVFNDGQRSGGHAFPRTAAGVCILYYLGDYDAPAVKSGVEYLVARKPAPGFSPSGDHYYRYFYFYGMFYATQALFQAGGRHWEEWYPAVRNDMLARQDASTGAFRVLDSYVREETYSTAMSLITLQVPYRLLPIFQR